MQATLKRKFASAFANSPLAFNVWPPPANCEYHYHYGRKFPNEMDLDQLFALLDTECCYHTDVDGTRYNFYFCDTESMTYIHGSRYQELSGELLFRYTRFADYEDDGLYKLKVSVTTGKKGGYQILRFFQVYDPVSGSGHILDIPALVNAEGELPRRFIEFLQKPQNVLIFFGADSDERALSSVLSHYMEGRPVAARIVNSADLLERLMACCSNTEYQKKETGRGSNGLKAWARHLMAVDARDWELVFQQNLKRICVEMLFHQGTRLSQRNEAAHLFNYTRALIWYRITKVSPYVMPSAFLQYAANDVHYTFYTLVAAYCLSDLTQTFTEVLLDFALGRFKVSSNDPAESQKAQPTVSGFCWRSRAAGPLPNLSDATPKELVDCGLLVPDYSSLLSSSLNIEGLSLQSKHEANPTAADQPVTWAGWSPDQPAAKSPSGPIVSRPSEIVKQMEQFDITRAAVTKPDDLQYIAENAQNVAKQANIMPDWKDHCVDELDRSSISDIDHPDLTDADIESLVQARIALSAVGAVSDGHDEQLECWDGTCTDDLLDEHFSVSVDTWLLLYGISLMSCPPESGNGFTHALTQLIWWGVQQPDKYILIAAVQELIYNNPCVRERYMTILHNTNERPIAFRESDLVWIDMFFNEIYTEEMGTNLPIFVLECIAELIDSSLELYERIDASMLVRYDIRSPWKSTPRRGKLLHPFPRKIQRRYGLFCHDQVFRLVEDKLYG